MTRTLSLFALLTLLLPGLAAASAPGANPLGVPRAEFAAAQEGMNLVYDRRYKEALQHFERVGIDFPDSALGPVGRELAQQAAMYERDDFSAERAWRTDAGEAEALLGRGRRQNDRAAWNAFLRGVHEGLSAMFAIRKGNNLAALNQAWDALESMKEVERLAPDFQDVKLARGMYDYWRTVYTERIDGLPSFGDQRERGLELMRQARDHGLLAPAPASLVLTYSYLEKGDVDAALAEALWNQERHPDNLMNLMILGRIQRKQRLNDEALATFQRAVRLAPEVPSTWYALGRQLERQRSQLREARDAYATYVKIASTPVRQANGWYRVGVIERRLHRYESSKFAFQTAADLNPKLTRALERVAQVDLEQQRAAERRVRARTERRATPRLRVAGARTKVAPR